MEVVYLQLINLDFLSLIPSPVLQMLLHDLQEHLVIYHTPLVVVFMNS